MKRLRIAVVTSYPPSQGSLNEYAYHFVRCLCEKPEVGEVFVLADKHATGYKITGSADSSVPEPLALTPKEMLDPKLKIKICWKFGSIFNPLKILIALYRIKPDIVLYNLQFASFGNNKFSASLGLTIPFLSKLAGFKGIVLLHNIMETVDLQQIGVVKNPVADKLYRYFGKLVTRLLLKSNLVALTIPKYVEILQEKYSAKNVLLAPHGSFYSNEQHTNMKFPGPAREPNSEQSNQIMAFGKFGTYKKIEILIEAYKLLKNKGRSNLELVIGGTDSPRFPGYLAEMQKKYSYLTGINYKGYIPEEEVADLFNSATLVVFPYESTTGSSGVLHQAGEFGKAVVLPRIGDFAEVIEEEGYTGEFFDPGKVESLAKAIENLLDNKDRREEIGKQNFLASKGLPMSEVIDWYLLHIQSVLENR